MGRLQSAPRREGGHRGKVAEYLSAIRGDPEDAQVLEDAGVAAVEVWNAMDGTIDWPAVPVLAQINGIDDIELLGWWLVEIRAAMKNIDKADPSG